MTGYVTSLANAITKHGMRAYQRDSQLLHHVERRKRREGANRPLNFISHIRNAMPAHDGPHCCASTHPRSHPHRRFIFFFLIQHQPPKFMIKISTKPSNQSQRRRSNRSSSLFHLFDLSWATQTSCSGSSSSTMLPYTMGVAQRGDEVKVWWAEVWTGVVWVRMFGVGEALGVC